MSRVIFFIVDQEFYRYVHLLVSLVATFKLLGSLNEKL